MTAAVEDMKVGDPVSVSRAGIRNGGESEELQFRSHLYGLKILEGKNVLYDFLSVLVGIIVWVRFWGWAWGSKWPYGPPLSSGKWDGTTLPRREIGSFNGPVPS